MSTSFPCSRGVHLLRELKRSPSIPPYDVSFKSSLVLLLTLSQAETVKLVIEETNALFNEIRTTLQYISSLLREKVVVNRYFRQCGKEARASSYISCGLMVNHTSMLRNKRILLAYL